MDTRLCIVGIALIVIGLLDNYIVKRDSYYITKSYKLNYTIDGFIIALGLLDIFVSLF